jgi:hypothetical protein
MRAKIILPNFIAVLVLSLAGFFYVRHDFYNTAIERLGERIKTTSFLYGRSETLRGFELLNNVRTQAMSKDVVESFAQIDIQASKDETEDQVEKKIRRDWFKRCVRAAEVYTELWLEKTGKRPELIFLTDRNGVVIARNITPNACPAGYNVAKVMPIVSRALDGEAMYSLWLIDESSLSSKKPDPGYCQLINTGLLELAAAPIWYGDDIAGALVLGLEVSNGTAQKKSEMMGLDIAVLTRGDVYSSSFGTESTRQSLEQQMDLPGIKEKIDRAIATGNPSQIFEIYVENKKYLALASPAVSSEKQDRIVTLIMGSVEQAVADFGSINVLLVTMVITLIIILVVGFVLTNHFLKPIMIIEEGILKVINGEYRYRFDVKSSEVGGLSYRINQLIGVLTGEEEESDQEE